MSSWPSFSQSFVENLHFVNLFSHSNHFKNARKITKNNNYLSLFVTKKSLSQSFFNFFDSHQISLGIYQTQSHERSNTTTQFKSAAKTKNKRDWQFAFRQLNLSFSDSVLYPTYSHSQVPVSSISFHPLRCSSPSLSVLQMITDPHYTESFPRNRQTHNCYLLYNIFPIPQLAR